MLRVLAPAEVISQGRAANIRSKVGFTFLPAGKQTFV